MKENMTATQVQQAWKDWFKSPEFLTFKKAYNEHTEKAVEPLVKAMQKILDKYK